jgi:hypothetical protein
MLRINRMKKELMKLKKCSLPNFGLKDDTCGWLRMRTVPWIGENMITDISSDQRALGSC